MPTSPNSSDAKADGNKKRNRTSLLSIISSDKKPNTSTSSSEGVVSPITESPAVSPATSPPPVSPKSPPPVSPKSPPPKSPTTQSGEVSDNASKRKSIPPPVSAKPKAKPPPTALKPSRPESKVTDIVVTEPAAPSSPSVVIDSVNNNVSPVSSPIEKISESINEELPPAEIDIAAQTQSLSAESDPTIIKTDNDSAGTMEADTLTQQPSSENDNMTSVDAKVAVETVVEKSGAADLNATIESLPPPPPELTSTEEISFTAERNSDMDIINSGADLDESVDFPPPPPPEEDFPAPPPDLPAGDVEALPLPPAIDEEDTPKPSQQAPPSATTDSSIVIQEAVDKIESKYDVSPVTQVMSHAKCQSSETQNSDTCNGTVANSGEHSDHSAQLSQADKTEQVPVSSMSVEDSNNPVISAASLPDDNADNESNVTPSAKKDEVDKAVSASQNGEPLSLQLNSEVSPVVEAKSPSMSSPLSETSQDNSEMSAATETEPALTADDVTEKTDVEVDKIHTAAADNSENNGKFSHYCGLSVHMIT